MECLPEAGAHGLIWSKKGSDENKNKAITIKIFINNVNIRSNNPQPLMFFLFSYRSLKKKNFLKVDIAEQILYPDLRKIEIT